MKIVPLNKKDMKKNWEKWGDIDPYWAVLGGEDKKGGKWDHEDFYARGVTEIESALAYMTEKSVKLNLNGHAIDFGCGLGRLTQALGAHFECVTGVDISSTMIVKARQYNRRGDKCKFVVNLDTDLKQFADETFDFAYSNIALQHIDPEYCRNYLANLVRVLKPGGVFLFQLTAERVDRGIKDDAIADVNTLNLLKKIYWRLNEMSNNLKERRMYRKLIRKNDPIIPMHGIPRAEVERLLVDSGGKVIDVQPDNSAGPKWISYRYLMIKQ